MLTRIPLKFARQNVRSFSQTASVQARYLVLGSGMVAGPLVDYLCHSRSDFVTVASTIDKEASALTAKHENAGTEHLDARDTAGLRKLVENHDVVISFVPAPFHPGVARVCVDAKKHLVTASYTAPEMAALSKEAEAAGVTILNELGVDPGIDHMSAMEVIDDVQGNGGEVSGFVSWCGGLPAPEDSANALGYKFSWAPRGVLTAALNSARFLENGKVVEVPGEELLANAKRLRIFKGFSLEGLPNRDSLMYKDVYKLGNAKTIFRGTLRYEGYSDAVFALRELGLLDTNEMPEYAPSSSSTWRELLAKRVGGSVGPELEVKLAGKIGQPVDGDVMTAIRDLGLLSESTASLAGTALDTLCEQLKKKLMFEEGERDILIMHHTFDVTWPNGKKEKRTSSLVRYGAPIGSKRPSAMAFLVGTPAAIGAKLIADGVITRRGCLMPTTPDVYEPILQGLAKEGIKMTEKILPADH